MRPLLPTLMVLALGLPAQDPDLYDVTTIRTFELTFQQHDWFDRLTQNYSNGAYYLPAIMGARGGIHQTVALHEDRFIAGGRWRHGDHRSDGLTFPSDRR
jgi:hypothetical protein